MILGFAGSVSDAFSLSEKFEGMLNKFSGNLMRSAVELAELWIFVRFKFNTRRASDGFALDIVVGEHAYFACYFERFFRYLFGGKFRVLAQRARRC